VKLISYNLHFVIDFTISALSREASPSGAMGLSMGNGHLLPPGNWD